MTEEHHQHLNKIRGAFILRLDQKYTAGQKEHGGNLWENNPIWLIDQVYDEAVDQVVYAQTVKDQWMEFLNTVVSEPDTAIHIATEWLKELQ